VSKRKHVEEQGEQDLNTWEETLLRELEEFTKTYLPLYRISEGENKLTIYMDTLQQVRTRFGEGLRVKVKTSNGVEYSLLLRRGSRLYRSFLRYLASIKDAEGKIPDTLKVIIIKRGSGMNVEYEIRSWIEPK